MARIFLKKLFQIITGGSSTGLGLDMGSQTESMTFSAVMTQAQGSQTESMGFSGVSTLPIGTQTETMAATASGSATFPQGSQTETMGHTEAATIPMGTQTETFSSNAVADTFKATSTAANSQTAGTIAWTNPTNAQGAPDATLASYPAFGATDTSAQAVLRCSGLTEPTAPSGFTRTSRFIRVRHKYDWDITGAVNGVTNVITSIFLKTSTGGAIATLLTHNIAVDGVSSQSSLIDQDFAITVTDAQVAAGLQVWFDFNGLYVTAVNGSATWDVDSCMLASHYTAGPFT